MVSSARGIKLPAHTAIIRITAPIASPTSAAAVDDAVEHVLALLLLDRHLIFAVVADSKPHTLATLAVTLVCSIQSRVDRLLRKGAFATHLGDIVGVGRSSHNSSVAETGRALGRSLIAVTARGRKSLFHYSK